MKVCELPVGAKLSDTARYFPWIVADQTQKVYPGTVLISDFLAEAGCYDASEPKNRFDDIRQFGWNRYPNSNVHQWLNSTETHGWFTPQNETDTPPSDPYTIEPYADKAGFLNGFSNKFLKCLETVDVTYAYQDDYYLLQHSTTACRVFLPSRTELGMEKRSKIHEGEKFAISDERTYLECAPLKQLVEAHNLCDRDFHQTSSFPYWTRSVDLDCMSAVYFCGMSRSPYFQANKGACGIRPVIVINSDAEIEDVADRFGVYLLKGENNHE